MPGEAQVGNEETFLLSKSGQALGRVAQGGGGVPVPGGVQGEVGRGAWGQGLVVTLVVGGRLDQMILEGFSDLNDSVITAFNLQQWSHLHLLKTVAEAAPLRSSLLPQQAKLFRLANPSAAAGQRVQEEPLQLSACHHGL